MSNSVGLVFVHGAGLHPWIWSRLIDQMERPCLAIEYPLQRDGMSFTDYANHVASAIANWDEASRVCLVGHSIGGLVAAEVANSLEDRLAGFIGLAAALPTGSASFLSMLPQPKRTIFRILLRLAGTKPPASAIRSGLCNGLEENHVQRIVDDFVPEAIDLYRREVAIRFDAPGMYIRTTEDQEFSVSQMDQFAAGLAGAEVHSVEAGHLAMLSHPGEIAAVIERFTSGLR